MSSTIFAANLTNIENGIWHLRISEAATGTLIAEKYFHIDKKIDVVFTLDDVTPWLSTENKDEAKDENN